MAVKDSYYVHGSDGDRNLFFREKGTEVGHNHGHYYDNYIALKDEWIIQWQGDCCWDSGYSAEHFQDYESAMQSFKKQRNEEYEKLLGYV